MGNVIRVVLDVIVKVVDAVPILKGKRTAICIGILAALAILDALKVGPGNLFALASPILWPVTAAFALAHENGNAVAAAKK